MSRSARSSIEFGVATPSALAAFRLITSSNVVACSTGISDGRVPLSILSTRRAAWRPSAYPDQAGNILRKQAGRKDSVHLTLPDRVDRGSRLIFCAHRPRSFERVFVPQTPVSPHFGFER